jgi:arsenate reductase-like glutaredoxin family protein
VKKLDDFRLVREFLSSQGIEPTIAMVAVRDPEWLDLVILAQEWRREIEEIAEAKEAKIAAMTPEEKDQMEAEAAEEARLEQERILFHSCGHKPERA